MTQPCEADLLKLTQDCGKVDAQTHNNFVDVRTRRGKLVFRLDPVRMLIEWRDGQDGELIDLMPYLSR